MTDYYDEDGVLTATNTFAYPCTVCGATVQVTEGLVEPHTCRIDLDAQRGRG